MWRLGNLPDYWAFVEYVLYAQSGATSYFSDPINPNGPVWIPIIMISWMLTQAYEYKDKYFLFCVMSVIAAIWVVFPYWVAHSQDIVVFKLVVPTFFGLFLLFSLLDEKSRMRHTYKFSPIFIMILVMSFGTPQTAKHVYDTITNQDYTLENTIDEEVDDMHHIFTMITPGDTPVSYIDPGRYLFFNRSNQYKDLNTDKMVTLNKKIWLPLHPADLFWDKMPLERKVEYINRWLIRHPVNEGWVVNANEQSYWWKHAHSIYEIALKQALSDKFKIKKIVEYGDLKAVLYERES